ncbi:MAG: hypothetical protein IPG93_04445 [Burkholderiales bacterium]|nr:hypothetical protein [Burkholderiales bacterium]
MRFFRTLACVLGLWATAASGQSIDPTRARATIGDPLDLEVLVRTTPELGAARLDRSCVQAEVLDGQRVIDDHALVIDIDPATDNGLNRLHIRHAAPVDEPVVQARVSLTCGANYTREFTVLPKVGTRPTGAARATTTKHRIRPAGARANPAPPGRTAVSGSPMSSPITPADVKASGVSTPFNGTQLAASHANGGDVEALARSVLRLFQAAGLDLQRSSQGLLDLQRPDHTASLAVADSKYLMQEVQRLRSESQQSATALASLHARIERAENDRWLHATWAVLAVVAGLVTLLIALRVAEVAAPALLRRFSRRTAIDDARSGDKPAKQGSSIEQYLNDIGARPLSTPSESPAVLAPQQPAAATAPGVATLDSNTLAFDETDLLAGATSAPPVASATPGRGQLQAVPAGHPLQASPRPNRWSHAEFGPPSLDHRRVRLHRDDIDKAIHDGYLGFALVMLEQLLYSGEGKHPWVLMRLIDVYRQLRQQDNHERVCAEIEALYNVRVPGYDAAPDPAEANDSLDQIDEWPALKTAWPGHEASPLIAGCLLRGNRLTDHSAATFADLLFLHELAEIRDAPPEMDALAA